MDSVLRFCGEPVAPGQLQLIQTVVADYPQLSRLELAKTVCELLSWARPNGQLKSRECRDLLDILQQRALIQLPTLRRTRPRGSVTRLPRPVCELEPIPIVGSLQALQPIQLQRITTPAGQAEWKDLIDRYHYLGYRVPYGAHIRYLIESSGPPATLLGCIQFSSPAWQMKARDRWIGWDDAGRKAGLQRIINNSRFLILPWVRIPNLASHLLSKAITTVVRDWEDSYAVRPVLVETLVDPARYSGHCYRAANWIEVGLTSGRGRDDREHDRHGQSPKRIFLYPLHRNASTILCQSPSI